jgi:cytochrome c oxidase cbb3-type subunit III
VTRGHHAMSHGMAALASLLALAACHGSSARPPVEPAALAPTEVMDFGPLYSANCAGCHGRNGRGGAALGLADPVYLAIAGDPVIRAATARGVPGTTMPAFAQSAGGMLTDAQIDVITKGIRSWSRSAGLDGATPPPYAPAAAGDPHRGEQTYGVFCASCHGARGEGTAKGSAITNDSFLALISDQGLRTVVITGRPELGAPGWRDYVPGRPISNEEVTDVVAWLTSKRSRDPGRPYPASARLP